MSLGQINIDPDDPFDKIVFLEDSLQQEGFNAGFMNGQRNGQEEGYNVGLQHGKELGKEIGFYKGFVSTWKHLANGGILKKRHMSLLEQLSKLLDSMNYENPEDEEMEIKIGKIRTKFKQLSSVLKLPVDVKKDPNSMMSF